MTIFIMIFISIENINTLDVLRVVYTRNHFAISKEFYGTYKTFRWWVFWMFCFTSSYNNQFIFFIVKIFSKINIFSWREETTRHLLDPSKCTSFISRIPLTGSGTFNLIKFFNPLVPFFSIAFSGYL